MADEKKQENTGIVEYESNGEIVKISPTTVRKYLVSGGGNVSDQEVMMFMSLCRYQHLNPFLKEAYLIKFGNNDPATIVTGKDVFTKRADELLFRRKMVPLKKEKDLLSLRTNLL